MIDTSPNITIRRLGDGDAARLARLEQLDSSAALAPPVLGAETDGRLVAALSLADRRSIADPFGQSADARALLELRAAQLRREPRRRRARTARPRLRARAALAGSAPGAGGRLLTLR
jgi:hypothetical protein